MNLHLRTNGLTGLELNDTALQFHADHHYHITSATYRKIVGIDAFTSVRFSINPVNKAYRMQLRMVHILTEHTI